MKKTKDVLLMCQFFHPEYVSSATLPFDTAVSLAEGGCSVGVLCGYPKEYTVEGGRVPKRQKVLGVEIRRLGYIHTKRGGFFGRAVNYFSFALAVFFNLFRAAPYRVIMVYSNPPVLPLLAVIAKKLFSCKVVFVSYDVYPEIAIKSGAASKGGLIDRVLTFVNRRVFRHADRVVAVSTDMEQFLRQRRELGEGCALTTIPNWYEDLGVHRGKAVSPLFSYIKPTDFVVSYLGNLGVCQDETTLIDAICRLKDQKDIQFVIGGHGSKMAELKARLDQFGVKNARVFPFLHGEDYTSALAVSSCFVLTLKEGLLGLCAPSKAYSYMMEGRAIGCVMDGQSEIALDLKAYRGGECFGVGQGRELAEFFMKLRSDPRLCREMGDNCRRIFLDKYEKEKCLAAYRELILSLLKDGERSGTLHR